MARHQTLAGGRPGPVGCDVMCCDKPAHDRGCRSDDVRVQFMAAAAVSSLACPLRRSTRLAHAHAHTHTRSRPPKSRPPARDPAPDPDHDSSSSDPENELTPRALRALKRQRLALDPDGLPFDPRARPRKRRKENLLPSSRCDKRPPSPLPAPLAPMRAQAADWQARSPVCVPNDSPHSPHSTATNAPLIPDPIKVPPSEVAHESRPSLHPTTLPNDPSRDMPRPDLSIPADSSSPSAASSDSSRSPEPLTPLTPLTPSPESSPGHDRQVLPLSPPHDPLPPPASLDPLPLPSTLDQPPLSSDSFSSPPPISLDPTLDTLIPFEGLHPQFDPDLSVQIPPAPPQLQGLELQDQFHSFPQQQLYVPPNPVFVRDREINIWKLACQERVDCLLRRYGIDYIKALVESEARSLSQDVRSPSSPGTSTTTQFVPVPPSQTKFRLYTPASYTYSSTTWGPTAGTRKAFPPDDENEDLDAAWPMDDADWVDADVDMEDEDEDDYEDDDDAAEGEGDATFGAVEGLVIADKVDTPPAVAMQVDDVLGKSERMQVDEPRLTTKATVSPEAPVSPRSPPATADLPLRPLTPVPHAFPSPPVTTLSLPPLSSLHVPLLSEPPRAFMGRGTPPDRRRLSEWSGSARFAANGMGPPLYLSPVPQRHASADVGIVPMSVDAPMHPPHTHGEWTSFLYSMLEGDGVGVGTNVGDVSHASEPTWYELGLGSVSTVVSENALELPLSHPHPHVHGRTQAAEQPVEEGNNSSSTLRFALG